MRIEDFEEIKREIAGKERFYFINLLVILIGFVFIFKLYLMSTIYDLSPYAFSI